MSIRDDEMKELGKEVVNEMDANTFWSRYRGK